MNPENSKVSADHLRRNAYLYIRQSTLHQVSDHAESTARQYALKQRATILGWPLERVIVIDQDLGCSAAGSTERAGFQQLVAEVGMGHAGIVLGLEVSRLARSSVEWHRLLEICALTDTLILDEDGLYDPSHFNDRLLLGLKGAMSEAELHVLRARLLGGLLSKARRGELRTFLPTGLVYDDRDQVVRDPDQRVRDAIELFFETFRRTDSAWAVVKHFEEQGLLFPLRLRAGPRCAEVVFQPLRYPRVIQMLHNPRYAGAFAYGRTRVRRTPGRGVHIQSLPRDEWRVLIHDAHERYISWAEYEANLKRLRENAQARGQDRRGPPREGPALLQGLAICGRCGERMAVSYRSRRGGVRVPQYRCCTDKPGDPSCQSMIGQELDGAIGALLLEAMTPLSLEVALAVDEELQAQANEVDRLRRQEVEHARYEAELAERRYRRVDPDNRLVANALEANWNNCLRRLLETEQAYEHHRQADQHVLEDSHRQAILALATDLPRLWRDPRTPHREKKRIVRLLIEDVTLIRQHHITAHVRFKGGATRTLTLPLPRSAPDLQRTDAAVVARIDQLLDDHSSEQVAEQLNHEGLRTGTGLPFTTKRVDDVRVRYHLKPHYQRLRDQGLWTAQEMAAHLKVSPPTIQRWYAAGLLKGRSCGQSGSRAPMLYEPPGPNPPKPQQGRKLLPRTTTTQ